MLSKATSPPSVETALWYMLLATELVGEIGRGGSNAMDCDMYSWISSSRSDESEYGEDGSTSSVGGVTTAGGAATEESRFDCKSITRGSILGGSRTGSTILAPSRGGSKTDRVADGDSDLGVSTGELSSGERGLGGRRQRVVRVTPEMVTFRTSPVGPASIGGDEDGRTTGDSVP